MAKAIMEQAGDPRRDEPNIDLGSQALAALIRAIDQMRDAIVARSRDLDTRTAAITGSPAQAGISGRSA